MMTVKDLITCEVQSSPDSVHWEPALPMPHPHWKVRLLNAYAVWTGEAIAIRQTTKADLCNIGGAAAADGSMSRNNSETLAAELLAAIRAGRQA